MSSISAPTWEAKRTEETRMVEDAVRDAGFDKVDAYRYNAASIRLRVVDSRFEGLSTEERDAMIEPCLARLPERTQADIISLFCFAPSELAQTPRLSREFRQNAEFDDPSPSIL